jgi:hypothetical protein
MAAITTRITSGTGATVKNLPLSSVEIDTNFINLNADIALRATIASPALTGTPTAPTPAANDNSTLIATTAFVAAGFLPIANPTATGTLTVPTIVGTSATNATSSTTGALKTAGGLAVVKDFYLGGNMYATGDITSAYTSDERLKTNIQEIKGALGKLKLLSGVTFNWNELSGKNQEVAEAGVLAGQVEVALPEAVVVRENGYKAVKYEQLSALIIQAIKEISDRLDTLESKLNGI